MNPADRQEASDRVPFEDPRRMGAGKRTLFSFGLFVLVVAVLDCGGRLLLKVEYGADFWDPGTSLYHFYPELEPVAAWDGSRTGDETHILLLGGSVLYQISDELERSLVEMKVRTVTLHNLTGDAYTSLDSFYRYRRVSDLPFDLIVYYHAINEVRANNCPASMFEDDYSHYWWYASVNVLARARFSRLFSLPMLLDLSVLRAREALGAADYLPMDVPRREYLRHGSDIKTRSTFDRNLTRVLTLARERQTQVLLMSFAYYVPKNYSLKRFLSRSLDYVPYYAHDLPIELWGRPANVVAGIDAHNDVIYEKAAGFDNVTFVDQAKLIPSRGSNFIDICHLSERGIERFVENILMEIASPGE